MPSKIRFVSLKNSSQIFLHYNLKQLLRKWYHELEDSEFASFNELKQQYANASIVADDRVIFNIHGNKYRLIVRVNFTYKAIQIKWFGTHAEYDKIDATTIQFED